MRDWDQDIGLKRTYALRIQWLLSAQVVVTNVVFVTYAALGVDWNVPDNVMIAWIGSTVVELIGLTAIVTRYLFPPRAAA